MKNSNIKLTFSGNTTQIKSMMNPEDSLETLINSEIFMKVTSVSTVK